MPLKFCEQIVLDNIIQMNLIFLFCEELA